MSAVGPIRIKLWCTQKMSLPEMFRKNLHAGWQRGGAVWCAKIFSLANGTLGGASLRWASAEIASCLALASQVNEPMNHFSIRGTARRRRQQCEDNLFKI
jgi:hypothetical protein